MQNFTFRKYIALYIFLIPLISISQSREPAELTSFSLTELKMPCYYHSSGSFLIVSKKEFFGFYKEDSKACKKVKFPHVDIKENILIGFKGFTLGCETPTIKAKATLNGENLLVTLTISKKGDCKKNQEIVYWAQIPKNQFPEDLNLKKDLKLEIEENYN